MGLMSAGGGGLTNSKLALATAEPSDVVLGKTFYAKDKVLKTGSATPKCVWAGRCWANGVANGSGYSTNGGYCTGGKGTYDSWINAGLTGYYAVWIDDGFSYRKYNAGERIAYRGPGQYGSVRAAFVSV